MFYGTVIGPLSGVNVRDNDNNVTFIDTDLLGYVNESLKYCA